MAKLGKFIADENAWVGQESAYFSVHQNYL